MASDTVTKLWQSFANLLTVKLEFGDPPDVTAIVSNTAPEDPQGPVIVFEDIHLTIKGGKVRQTSNINTLQPGAAYEVGITTQDPAGVSVKVEGRVSHRRFFSVQSRADPPIELTSPVVQEYLERLETLGFLDIFESGRKSLAAVGPDTTLNELEKLTDVLDKTNEAIRVYGESARCQVTIAHTAIAKTMAGYLTPLATNVRRAREASQKGDTRTLLECRDAVLNLDPPFKAFSATVSELRDQFGISG